MWICKGCGINNKVNDMGNHGWPFYNSPQECLRMQESLSLLQGLIKGFKLNLPIWKLSFLLSFRQVAFCELPIFPVELIVFVDYW